MNTTPPLGQLLNNFTRRKISEIHTAYPGEIVSYDASKFQASIKILIKKEIDGVEYDYPILNNVPVLFPKSENSHVIFPLQARAQGICIFQERSIDGWQELGKALVPEDKRMHDLNDGVFIPGLSPKNRAPQRHGAIDSLEASLGGAYVEIQKSGTIKIANSRALVEVLSSGKIKIQGPNGELIEQLSQLMSLIDELLTALSTALVATLGGPQPLSNAAQYTILKTMLLQISTKIDSLKA